MVITIKYDRKDFFGQKIYTEDVRRGADFSDLKKSWSALSRDPYMSIWIDNIGYYWDSASDYEHRIITKKVVWSSNNNDTFRLSFEPEKKHIYETFRPLEK